MELTQRFAARPLGAADALAVAGFNTRAGA